MRTVLRSAALVLLAAPLAACSLVPPVVTGKTGGQGVGAPVTSGSAEAKPGPLGILPVPSGATAWSDNATAPMNAKGFVHWLYKKSAWSAEEGDFARCKFQSGIGRGWDNADGSSQDVSIMRFAGATGAKSQFNSLTGTLYDDLPKGGKKLSDSADGAAGTSDPTLDSDGDTTVELVARVGDTEVVDVHEYTAATPDPAAAKALILKQVKALKAGH